MPAITPSLSSPSCPLSLPRTRTMNPPLIARFPSAPQQSRHRLPTRIAAAAGDNDDDAQQKLAAMQEAMKNPAVAAQLKAAEEAMNRPEVQQQMAQMNAMMSNPAYLQRMAELREDPDLKPIFEEIKSGGMAAMMKYMNDPTFLSKIGEKLGDLETMVGSGAGGAAAAAPPPPPPQVLNILDAAKYGDIEAVEDYMAIGKGDMRDEAGRCALHYAVAYNQGASAMALLANGANVNDVDGQGNTALHFAAGYGRVGAVTMLIDAGADTKVKNADGKTAVDLIKEEPRNPLNNNSDVLNLLL